MGPSQFFSFTNPPTIFSNDHSIHEKDVVSVERVGKVKNQNSCLLVGMKGFGFELLETDNRVQRGRYLERIIFKINQDKGDFSKFFITKFLLNILT